MIKVHGYATHGPREPLRPHAFERREPGPRDVLLDVLYCGICHSDIHQARDEWGGATYPMVPGHEIVGRVAALGREARTLRVGDLAGVGCMVGSCGACANCREGYEQYCEVHTSWTYGGTEQDGTTPTQGGYSTRIVVDERFVLRVPDALDPARAAPLLCAGVTTWAPLRRHGVEPGHQVGVVGLGGLGHMAVKLAVALGAEVTVFSTSPSKKKDARELGASRFVVTREPDALAPLANRLHLVVDTVSAPHDVNALLGLLRRDGALVLVGLPEKSLEADAFAVVTLQRSLSGSNIGGVAQTQEMLDFCAAHGIGADVEVIAARDVNNAYERTLRGDVRFRFVIDAKTF